jgi:hypothetical protein
MAAEELACNLKGCGKGTKTTDGTIHSCATVPRLPREGMHNLVQKLSAYRFTSIRLLVRSGADGNGLKLRYNQGLRGKYHVMTLHVICDRRP